MADEAVRAPALGGVTERLDAQDDAHGADDDDVPITRSEGTKHSLLLLLLPRAQSCYFFMRSQLFSALISNFLLRLRLANLRPAS